MLLFQSVIVDVPQPDTALIASTVQMDIPKTWFVRNVGPNQVRVRPQESANGSTYVDIPGKEAILDPNDGALIYVETTYPFQRLMGNGNSQIEVGMVGSFVGNPITGVGLMLVL